jgi:hypothetical protein
MTGHACSQLVSNKRWADCGLYDVVGKTLERLDTPEAAVNMARKCLGRQR